MGKSQKDPKLPWRQLFILSICRFAEPVALTSVFPYLPEMIESFNIPQNEVAKWAGITSAVFSLSQCLTAIAWGRASDQYGRKPAIMVGLFCTMCTSLLWGFSRSLAWAITARALAGISNGTVGIIRTTVAEMVPQKALQPRAFSVMPLVWTIGSIFGPMLGGALAKPVTRYPSLFGHSEFLKKFPFALPNMVASVLFLFGISTGILFLKETLETRKHRRDYGRIIGKLLTRLFTRKKKTSRWKYGEEQASSLLKHARGSSWSTLGEHETTESSKILVPTSPPSYREVFSPQSNLNLLTYLLLALHSIAYDQLLPVFLHLPPQVKSSPYVQLPLKFAGGFGLDSSRIGLLFTLYGVSGMVVQFLIFPPLARRFGVLYCLKACTMLFPVGYLLTPFTVLLPTPVTQQTAIAFVMFIKCIAGVFAFPCATILMTNSAQSLRLLGTLNGVAVSLSAIGRAIGPTIGGITFTFGVDRGYIIIPFFTLAFFAALGNVPVWWLVELDGFGGPENSESEDEEEESLLARTDSVDGGARSSGIQIGGHDGNPELSGAGHDQVVDDVTFEENLLINSPGTITKTFSNDSQLGPVCAEVPRRMSSPLGLRESVGPGGGRRLSNGLGQTLTGLGTGGSTF